MNNAEIARRAYAPAGAPTRMPRDAEKQVLQQATANLRRAAADPSKFTLLAEALHLNRMLWARLAADVADKDNGLPQDLRARLFYLAEFTNHHSSKVLSGTATAEPLIEINMAVMRGLSSSVLPAEGAA